VNLSIRNTTCADYDVFARLHVALELPDPVPSAEQFAKRMLPNVTLACDAGQPVGYAHWGIYGAAAHVIQIVVDAVARRRGVGRLLMNDLRTRVLANGCTRWYLNVKAENAAAIRLYEGVGLAIEQRGWALISDWVSLQGLPGATSQVTSDATEQEVARLAQQQTIDPERLAMVRARPGQVFVAPRDDAGLCAFAALDPKFPGIHPIAVRLIFGLPCRLPVSASACNASLDRLGRRKFRGDFSSTRSLSIPFART